MTLSRTFVKTNLSFFFILVTLSLTGKATFDSSFTSDRKLAKVIQFENDKIQFITVYKLSGEPKYTLDYINKVLESFDALSYEDTFAENFKNDIQNYKRIQHFGNGPIKEIEHYTAGVRNGKYQEYNRNGTLILEGNTKNWGKIGIWKYYVDNNTYDYQIHWFNHAFIESGVSIKYTLIPSLITLLLLFTILYFLKRNSSYKNAFIWTSIIIFGFFVSLIFLDKFFENTSLTKFFQSTSFYNLAILSTSAIFNFFLCLYTFIAKKYTRVNRLTSMFFLIISVGLLILTLYVSLGSKISGTMLG